jgi:acetolactate synthase-1/3 small subunit
VAFFDFEETMLRTIRILAENKPGALMRVTGILTAKGLNIETLTLAPTQEMAGISEILISAQVEPWLERRVVAEMNRLVNVLEAEDITEAEQDGEEAA